MSSATRLPSHSPLAMFLLLVVFLLLLPFASSTCSDPSDISCGICPHSSPGNDLAGLPRVNARGRLISNDLASYSWYSCDAFGQHCVSFLSNPQYSHWLNQMPDDSHPINYVQSIAAYCLFALACLLVALAIGFSLCCCRYWYDRDIGGLCGGVHPQRKLRWIGVVIDPDRRRWVYRPWERWMARGLMVIFVALTWTWVGLGYFNGTAQLPAAVKESTASPAGIAATVQATQGPVVQLLVRMAGDTLYNAISNVSDAFTHTVPLPTLVTSMQCVSGPIHGLLNATSSTAFLQGLTAVAPMIASTADAVDVALNASVASLSSPLSLALANLTQYNASSLTAAAAITHSASNVTALIPYAAVERWEGMSLDGALMAFNATAPNRTTLVLVANSTSASLAQLIPNNSTVLPMPLASDRALLLARFSNLTTTLASLPNMTAVALNASLHNADVSAALSSLSSVLASMVLSMAALSSWSSLGAQFNASIAQYTAASTNFSLSSELAMVSALNASVQQWTVLNQGLVLGQLAQLRNLTTVLPCMSTLIPLLNATDAELITLPSDITDVLLNYSAQLNATLPTAITQLTNVSWRLANLSQGTSTTLNYAPVIHALNNGSATLSSIIASFNATLSHALIAAQPALLSIINLQSAYASLLSLNASLQASLIPTSFIASLTAYQSVYQAMSANFTAFNADLVRWNADGHGVKRCNVNQATNCTYNRQCPPGDYCLIDYDRVALMEVQLAGYTNNYPPSAALTTVVATGQASNASAVNASLSTTASRLTSLAAGLSGVPSATPGVAATIQPVLGQLQAFTLPSLDAAFASLSANVSSSLNFSSAVTALTSLNASTALITANMAPFDATLTLLTTIDTFLFSLVPSTYAPLLLAFNASSTPPSTQSQISNLTLSLAALVNAMVDALDASPLIAANLGSYDFVGRSQNLRGYLDLLYTDDQLQFGPVHWLANVYNLFDSAFTALTPANFLDGGGGDATSALVLANGTVNGSVNATSTPYPQYNASEWAAFTSYNGLSNRVNADHTGAAYPSGYYCLTQACLDNTVDYYTNTGLSTLTSGTIPVAVTAPHLNGLLFLVPAFIGLLGLVALGLFRSYKWSSVAASVTAGLILVFLPLVFLFAMVLFPAVMVQGDVCYGGVNLGYSLLQQQHDTVCTAIGGTGTADNCVYLVDGFSIILDLPRLYTDVLGGQCSDDATDDAVLALFNSVRSSASTWPDQKVSAAIASFNNNTAGVQLQPAFAAILHAAAQDTSASMDAFITDVAGGFTCEALSANWAAIHSSFCCSVTAALYWFFGCWFLIGLSMLGCGVPAAVCGRKRLAADIPSNELRIIDRHFSKERVLKEEGWVKKSRALSVDRRRSQGSVVPLSAEVDAIEMAYLKAEKEKIDAEAARRAGNAGEGGAALDPADDQPGGQGQRSGSDAQLGGAMSARGSRIDVVVASPSASLEPSVAPRGSFSSSHDGADADDRRGLNIVLGGDGAASARQRPASLDHPMGFNRSHSSYSPRTSTSVPPRSPVVPLTPSAPAMEGEADEPPTPMAILVHRPSLVVGEAKKRGGLGVFSYSEDAEEEDADPSAFVNKWPSLSLGGLEERRREEEAGDARPSVSGSRSGSVLAVVTREADGLVSAVAASPPAAEQTVEGIRDAAVAVAGDDSSDDVSSSSGEDSDDDDEKSGNHAHTTSTIPMPRFQ